MVKITGEDLIKALRKRIPIENVFSGILLVFIFILFILISISPEEERFVKNMHVYYFMIFFLILIFIMQSSLRLNMDKQRKQKYRELTPSKIRDATKHTPSRLQKIIRENLHGGNYDGDKRNHQGLRNTFAERYSPEREKFFTPRSSYGNSTRYRPGVRARGYFNDSPHEDKLASDRKFYTPHRSKFNSKSLCSCIV